MECLRNWIGVQNCAGLDTPLSGLFINSLPGFSLEMADKIANAEQVTFSGVWSDIQTAALYQLDTELRAALTKRYRLKTVTQSIDLLRRIDTAQVVVAGTVYRGFMAELTYQNDSGYVASNFQQFSFQTLSLYVNTGFTGTVAIKIFDLQTGTVLDTITLTNPVTGWNLIQVNRKYTAYRIFVGYDATLVASYVQDISKTAQDFLCGYSSLVYGYGSKARIKGAVTASLLSSVTDDEITQVDSTAGLSAVFSVQCSYQSFICNNKDIFTLPLWYLLGSQTMVFRINTNRLNRYTTVDKKQAQELKDYYDTEYKAALELAVEGTDLNLADACIECNAQLKTVEAVL